MSKNIEISDIEIPLLVDFYTSQLNKKQKEVDALKKTLDKLTANKLFSVKEVDSPIVNGNGYNLKWTWNQKIDFILKGKALTTSEVVAVVLENEPNRANERSSIVGSVSAVLSSKSKGDDGHFIKTQNVRNENVFSIRSEKTAVNTAVS